MKVGEDSDYSVMTKVELKKLFHNKKVRSPALILSHCVLLSPHNIDCSSFVWTDTQSERDKSFREPRESGNGEEKANLESTRHGRWGGEAGRSGGRGGASGWACSDGNSNLLDQVWWSHRIGWWNESNNIGSQVTHVVVVMLIT